jgi:hypothetical protein
MPRDTRQIDYLLKRPEAACDTECYIDYWSIGFKNLKSGKKVIYEKFDGQSLDCDAVMDILRSYRIYTFNGINYDVPMICLALAGASNKVLKQASDAIIVGGLRHWAFFERFNISPPPGWFDHIDLYEVAPGVQLSLKKYGARMNMPRLQELPIHPSEEIGEARRPLMRRYLGNDLDTTGELALRLFEEVEIRAVISDEYKVDVRSKSDAQIAETLMKVEVERKMKREVERAMVKKLSFNYEPPPFIKFETDQLRNILKIICNATFFVSDIQDPPGTKKGKKNYGVVRLPKAIKDIKLRIGFTDYKMGIGGLHSKEKKRSYIIDEDTIIEDRDVRAYYPRLMLACGYVPPALGDNFLGIFSKFVNLRDSYKEKAQFLEMVGDASFLKYKRAADTFKIVNNGIFGKTGSPFAIVYAPKLMISTTITGQLSLLMLIERLHMNGFEVISANTDGIVTVIPKDKYWLFNAIVFDWECDTTFSTEALRYKGVYSRDVNSYIAVPADFGKNPKSKVKRKGLFAKAGLQDKHDPTYDICSTAVVDYLTSGKDIEQTILACDDFTQFIGVKQVAGGGRWRGEYLGKMVRWYHSTETVRDCIEKPDGSRVAGTSGAKPCMDLPAEFPDDVDYNWYVREAYARLDDIGLKVRDPEQAKRHGYMLASLPKQKTAHIVDLQTRRSLCDREEKEVRQAWEEHKAGVPDHMRVCRKCQEERGYVDPEDEDD